MVQITKATPGSDSDVWGDITNTALDALAAAVTHLETGDARVYCANDAPQFMKDVAEAVSDGSATSDTAILTDAFAVLATGQEVRLFGTFNLQSAVSVIGVDNVRLGGLATIYTPDISTAGVEIKGQRINMSATVTGTLQQGATQIVFDTMGAGNPPSAGDWIALVSAVSGGKPWGGRPDTTLSGEWVRVESYDTPSRTATLRTPLRETYEGGTYTFQFWKYVLAKGVRVEGIRFIAPGGAGHPITTPTQRTRPLGIQRCERPIVRNVSVEGPSARHGMYVDECLRPLIQDVIVRDVYDSLGGNGTHEGFGVHVMGCEGAVVERVSGRARTLVMLEGGITGYQIGNATTRPINRNSLVQNVIGDRCHSAAVGEFAGSDGTVVRDVAVNGGSGAVFLRGRRPSVLGRITQRGTTDEIAPYTQSQGDVHMIRIGEPPRLANGSVDATNRLGWSGTGLVVDVVADYDVTGSTATAHAFHCEHPLVGAYIDLRGVVRPTGNVINATGQFNEDTKIRVRGADCAAAASGAGWLVNLRPDTVTPDATVSYTHGMDIEVQGNTPRSGAVYIAGSVGVGDVNRPNRIQVTSKGLGTGLSATSPMVSLGLNPNTGSGSGFHPTTRLVDCSFPNTNARTAVGVATGAAVSSVTYDGVNAFADGCRIPDVVFLPVGRYREPRVSNKTAAVTSNGMGNNLYLHRTMGCGQSFNRAAIAITTAMAGGAGSVARVVAYADDGTGQAPALNVAPLQDFGTITLPTTTGTVLTTALGSNWKEPVGYYWIGVVLQWGTAPTTYPNIVMGTSVEMYGPSVLSSGSTIANGRCYAVGSVTGAPGALASLTEDYTARPIAGLLCSA